MIYNFYVHNMYVLFYYTLCLLLLLLVVVVVLCIYLYTYTLLNCKRWYFSKKAQWVERAK